MGIQYNLDEKTQKLIDKTLEESDSIFDAISDIRANSELADFMRKKYEAKQEQKQGVNKQ